ncbi:hypothetical protein FCV25MIE_02056 [Fagus crenata]
MEAWKNIFPLTEKSRALGFLDPVNPAWLHTLNPWWYSLLDQPHLPLLGVTTSEWSTLPSQQPLSENSLTELELGILLMDIVQDSSSESDRMCCDGQPIPSETSLVFPPENRMHLDDQKLFGAFGDTQARNDFAPRPSKVEGSIDSLIEVERDRR